MDLTLASDLWKELRNYISPSDRADAADMVVETLMYNDHEVAEIASVFGNDTDIRRSLQAYRDEQGELEKLDEDDDYEYEEDEDY